MQLHLSAVNTTGLCWQETTHPKLIAAPAGDVLSMDVILYHAY